MGWTRAKSRHDVPNVPGVYAVFCGGSLVYIGFVQAIHDSRTEVPRDAKEG